MKLLAVTDSLAPSDGPGRYASNLLRALSPSLEAVEIAVPARHGPIDPEIEGGCTIHRLLPSRHLFFLRRPLFLPLVLGLALRLAPAARRADLVHAVKDYPFSLIAALAARIARRPLVAGAFGTYALLPLRTRGHRAGLRFVYRRAARILCISRHTADRLHGHVAPDKLRLLPPAVDERFLSRPPNPEEAQPPYLLSVGLVRERKGLDVSVAAFLSLASEFPELEYQIAGGTRDDATCRRLRSLLESHPEGRRVRLLGEVDEARLLRLYDGCTAFVLTPREDSAGRFEGLGLVYLEASARGKPVIGTTGCGAEDAVVDGVTGCMVPPGDARATAACLRPLLTDPELRRRLGQAGKTRAAELTWDRTAAVVREAYAEATGLPAK